MKKLLLLLCVCSISINAQDVPFNCDYNAYLFQYNDVYAIDLASGNSYTVATDVTESNINATAYNPADGFIWGSISSPQKSIIRIGKDFKTTTYYIDELPNTNRYVGDISAEGIYYLKGGGTDYYSIELNPDAANYGKYIETLNLSKSISIHDWAFNAVDNKLYSVEKKTNILYRIDAKTGDTQSLGEVPILSGLSYTYGAVYFDASGRFYVSANQTGTIYVIQNVQDIVNSGDIESNLFAFGPSSAQNDGARCPTAPVPQEICDNGIDDDGDGLIDCEDPSCSGYADCPVIEISSSANQGGLESNNRLSQQISKRNFNRVKTNYKFDKTSAKKFSKSSKYGKISSSKVGIQLSDFVPSNVINEDDAIESSPEDLKDITNATEVYSVDYFRQGDAIASILILETENGVYEHTKYICDRLLGAQLISVSTIEIKEQQFIKSLIRNNDGSLEFVLSLSAKSINNDTNFGIESHWNLDKYENDIGYYNFQIWSNSLDDLYSLGEEVVRLLDVQKPITSYNNSTAPTVFVRTGTYKNGKLKLQIVNTNRSSDIIFDAGVRATETDAIEQITTDIDLNGDYISNIEVDAGTLFDIGFRIGDGIETPDDLFMSDGSWGYDDAALTTNVINYKVQTNKAPFNTDEFPIERNMYLKATTSEYIRAYRALTPKFSPIDLTAYDNFDLQAKGTGTLIIRLIKEHVTNWEAQHKISIELTDNLRDYKLPFSEFKSNNGSPLEVNDLTSIAFTMLSDNGKEITKEMTLEQLRFSTNKGSTEIDLTDVNGTETLIIPNPMTSAASIHFTSQNIEVVELIIYNQIGRLIKQIVFKTELGKNEIKLDRGRLNSGIYFYKIKSKHTNYKTSKLLLE